MWCVYVSNWKCLCITLEQKHKSVEICCWFFSSSSLRSLLLFICLLFRSSREVVEWEKTKKKERDTFESDELHASNSTIYLCCFVCRHCISCESPLEMYQFIKQSILKHNNNRAWHCWVRWWYWFGTMAPTASKLDNIDWFSCIKKKMDFSHPKAKDKDDDDDPPVVTI